MLPSQGGKVKYSMVMIYQTYAITYQNTAMFVVTAVRSSNLVYELTLGLLCPGYSMLTHTIAHCFT
jgi:hypothetical protein